MLTERVTVSVVSHGQGALARVLLMQLDEFCGDDVTVVLTCNVPENLEFDADTFRFPLKIIRNDVRAGFGANHNAASRHAKTRWYCVANPDLRLTGNPFPDLVDALSAPGVGIVAPRILNPAGEDEDNARRFPTVWSLARKILGVAPRLDYEIGAGNMRPDWVAGMFMLMDIATFRELGGFDERFFLYYEDVDFCRRARLSGYGIELLTAVTAIHDARRESHRNPRYLRWHARSMLLYLITSGFGLRLPSRR